MGNKNYVIIAMLILGVAMAKAQDIEVPEDAPRETWQLIYDDYRSMGLVPAAEIDQYKNLTKDVTVVRGEDCLYIQGLTNKYPESWAKVSMTDSVADNRLLLWSNQPMEGLSAYLNCGDIKYIGFDGNTFSSSGVGCEPTTQPLQLFRNLSEDCVRFEAKSRTGYWIQEHRNQKLYHEVIIYIDGRPQDPEDTVFRDMEIYMNPRLIDKTAGIVSVSEDDGEDTEVYTLAGVRVDRENLSPGIYVSRGKKIVIK